MPPQQTHPSDQGNILCSDGSQQSSGRDSPNETTLYKVLPHKEMAAHQEKNKQTTTGIQMSPVSHVGKASSQTACTRTTQVGGT